VSTDKELAKYLDTVMGQMAGGSCPAARPEAAAAQRSWHPQHRDMLAVSAATTAFMQRAGTHRHAYALMLPGRQPQWVCNGMLAARTALLLSVVCHTCSVAGVWHAAAGGDGGDQRSNPGGGGALDLLSRDRHSSRRVRASSGLGWPHARNTARRSFAATRRAGVPAAWAADTQVTC
jgi:hypothetical protein